jgi:ABC-type transport system involved in cytochrome bd biosynthesis fused ATPase/permease subunit
MDNNLKNILSESNKEVDNTTLLAYLNSQLPENEVHEIEKKMLDDNFMNDAVEGLQKVKAKGNIDQYVDQLNKDLHTHLSKRKRRNKDRFLENQIWVYIAIVIILSLIVLSYVVIRYFLKQ